MRISKIPLVTAGVLSSASSSAAIVVFDANNQTHQVGEEYSRIASINLQDGSFIANAPNNLVGAGFMFSSSVDGMYGDYFHITGFSIRIKDTIGSLLDPSALSFSSADSFVPGIDRELSQIPLGTHYVGLVLLENSQSYYGWLEFTRVSSSEFQMNQFAFNDVAGQSILAGQTTAVPEASTLGFAGGLFGLVALAHARRRRQKQAAASEKFLALAAGEKLN
ncbi:MAG: hypothetical protein ACK5VI_00525 [Opitutia bacterium]|jgi:hypothetical protein